MRKKISTIFLLCFVAINIFSQDTINNIQKLPSGITFQYGYGNMSIKDYYLVKNKYSGITNCFNLIWNNYHSGYHNRIEIKYEKGKINNKNISAAVQQFSFNRINLYPIGSFKLFSKSSSVYLGPSADIFVHYMHQNIADYANSSIFANSVSILMSVGFNTEIIYSLNGKFNMVFNNNVSILSIGGKQMDYENSDNPMFKLLTAFNGLNCKTNISFNYQLQKHLSVNLGYQSFLSRITAWKGCEFYNVNNHLFISLIFNFK